MDDHPESEGRDALAPRDLGQPHHERLSPADPNYEAIVRAHRAALREGSDLYVDPATGLSVLTAAYLARRGRCCVSGCRHCPYVS